MSKIREQVNEIINKSQVVRGEIKPPTIHIITEQVGQSPEQAINEYLAKHSFDDAEEIKQRYLNNEPSEFIEFITFKVVSAVREVIVTNAKGSNDGTRH